MANVITHVYFAKKVYEALSDELQNQIKPFMDAFLFGGVGPDYLFALRELKDKSERYPNIMQYKFTFEVFTSIVEHLKKHGDKCQTAYALGLLCHYVLDFNIHPFVNFMAEEGLCKYIPEDQQAGIHSLCESAIDEYIITNLMGYNDSNLYKPAQSDFKTTKQTKNAIADLYTDAVNKVVGVYPSKFKLKLAVRMTTFMMRFFTDKSGKKRAYFSKKEANSAVGKKLVRNLMHPPEFYNEVDYLNLKKLPFRKVRNKEELINLSALEILDNCVVQAASYINNFCDAIKGKKPLDACDYSINYEGCDTTI